MIWLYLITGALLLGISEVLRYYHEPKAKAEKYRKKINWAWHIYRDLALLCYIIFGYLLSQENLIVTIPLAWFIHWTLTDGIQNILKGKSFFYRSQLTGNWAEKFGLWYIKISLLFAGLTLKIYGDKNASRTYKFK